MRLTSLAAFTAVVCVLPLTFAQEVKVVEKLPAAGRNSHYIGNREPLLPSPLIKLPLGAVKPAGWLRKQIELMGDGFIGHLSEISPFCRIDNNAWTHPQGEGPNGWEEVPYWLKGYYNLGSLLNDRRILNEAEQWLKAVMASQRPNGYFGSAANEAGGRHSSASAHGWPTTMLGKVPDLWPNMVMLYPLRSYYEATGDRKVLDFMLKYFRWQTTIPLEHFLPFSWQQWRAGDNLDLIHWLYNQTGEAWLLDLARVNHERTANWTGGMPSWHVVNIAQCFRSPAQFYPQAKDRRYIAATERVYDTIRELYGQTPAGLYGADENARPGINGPRQGTETCAMVEIMYSHSLLASITGDPVWLDRSEEVAFNALPASMTPDLKGLHYLTSPNQIQLDKVNKAPAIQNGGDMFSYNPYQYRCCQHNVAFGWPYYAEYSWMAIPGNGLAATYYVAGEVTAKVGDGVVTTVRAKTDYPFDEVITFEVAPAKPVRFPLALRIPAWARGPKLTINGKPAQIPASSRGWLMVDRMWRTGDTVQLELPMHISTTVWTRNRNTVSVHRGPLTYSLKIGERWPRAGGTDKWPGFEVYPTTSWNYGLELGTGDASNNFTVEKKPGPVAAQPFTPDAVPIQLKARGRRIAEWKQEPSGMVAEVQMSPVRSSAPVEELTLIPMGAARLRISSFPTIGSGSDAHVWKENLPIILASTASHYEPPDVIGDGLVPSSSSDGDTPRFAFSTFGVGYPPERGLLEWVEYHYAWPRKFTGSEVYWAQDAGARPRCRLPANWTVQWWDGKAWKPVKSSSGYETKADAFSQVSFEPVETNRIRLRIEVDERATAGIYEWRVQ
jgi:DUF1680 family protein